MKKCALCLTNKADDTGSHVVPHFLVKKNVNVDGKKERDLEVSFDFGQYFAEPYFGDAVLPEKIRQVLGRDLTDEEAQNQVNHYTVDYLWCKKCEEGLSRLEDYYAPFTHKHVKGNQLNVDTDLAKLFWYSIVWRFKVSGGSIKMSKRETRRIRYLLHQCIDSDIKKIKENVKLHRERLDDLNYKLFYIGVDGSVNNSFLFTHPILNKPYYFLIHDYLLIPYSTVRHIGLMKQDMFTSMIEEGDFANSGNPGFEHVNFASKEQFDELIESFTSLKFDNWVNNLQRLIKEVANEASGMKVTDAFVQTVMYKVINEDKRVALAERYTLERIATKIYEVFQMAESRRFL